LHNSNSTPRIKLRMLLLSKQQRLMLLLLLLLLLDSIFYCSKFSHEGI
jgi:hypothetical protein